MKALLVVLLLVAPALAGNPVPSGPLRAYKGPEGEIIVIVPVNDDKQALVHFRHLGGELEGKTRLYELEDLGHDKKNIYERRKRGSKTERFVVIDERDGEWEFSNPTKPSMQFGIVYSEVTSDKIKVDEVMNAYKP